MVIVGILLVVVLLVGTAVHGQKNWIDFGGPFRIQPSEFAKLAIIMWGADVLDRKYHLLEQRNHLLFPVLPVSFIVLALVVLQGDLGTAMVMMPIMASLLYFVGAPRKWFLLMGAAFLSAIAALSIAAPYRMARFTSWLDPYADAQGTGFQVIHGQQALGSGGFWGVGLGGSREKWGTLPEAHTDFIYAFLGEELGIIGSKKYIESLDIEALKDIALYLNFDMIGSPNPGYFTYDGDQSTALDDGQSPPRVPEGSPGIERTLVEYLKSAGKAAEDTSFDGRSDYDGFTMAGIPAGGLFTGAEENMTAEEAALWGGTADAPHDPNYHKATDTLEHVDRATLGINGGGVASVVGIYAQDLDGRNGMPARADRTRHVVDEP
jgi:hypothetical protein